MNKITIQQINAFLIHALDNNLLKHDDCKMLFTSSIQKYERALSSHFNGNSELPIKYSLQCAIYYNLVTCCIYSNESDYNDCIKHIPTICSKLPNPLHYYYNTNLEWKLFFNQHCFDEFLTRENIQKYVLFTIEYEKRHILHVRNLSYFLCEFMKDEMENDVHKFIANKIKEIGLFSHVFFGERRFSIGFAHLLLSDFPLYVEHTNDYFKKRKEEMVWIAEEVYESYDGNVLGHRVMVETHILWNIVKFL